MFSFFKNIKSIQNKTKLKIISAYDFRFNNIGKKSEKNIKKYANFFNFDYEIYKIQNNKQRPVAWQKIDLLKKNLSEKKYDYILWIDSDAFFCKYENILNDIDPSKNLSIVFHYIRSSKKNNKKHIVNFCYAPNSGFMVFKNSEWSLNFLTKMWDEYKRVKKHPNWDNASLFNLLGMFSETNNKISNKYDKKIFSKINFLPLKWNSVPNRFIFNNEAKEDISCLDYDPIVIHLAGMRRKNRIKFLKKYKEKIL